MIASTGPAAPGRRRAWPRRRCPYHVADERQHRPSAATARRGHRRPRPLPVPSTSSPRPMHCAEQRKFDAAIGMYRRSSRRRHDCRRLGRLRRRVARPRLRACAASLRSAIAQGARARAAAREGALAQGQPGTRGAALRGRGPHLGDRCSPSCRRIRRTRTSFARTSPRPRVSPAQDLSAMSAQLRLRDEAARPPAATGRLRDVEVAQAAARRASSHVPAGTRRAGEAARRASPVPGCDLFRLRHGAARLQLRVAVLGLSLAPVGPRLRARHRRRQHDAGCC